MSFYWSFWTSGSSLLARVSCFPAVPGSIRIEAIDGINDKVLTDDGDGNLVGDGVGVVDYDYGFIGVDFSLPMPVTGTEVKASYESVEGGCVADCEKCPTHYVKLDITPGAISGSSDFTLADAWRRLFEKIRRDILPIHVEILPDIVEEEYVASAGYRFDLIPADDYPLDVSGLHTTFDDTTW